MTLTNHADDIEDKTLIITSSGGGGHKMASAAKTREIIKQIESDISKIELEMEKIKKNPELNQEITKMLELSQNEINRLQTKKENIPERDVMLQWAIGGKRGIKLNDELAKKGDIKKIERLIKLQPIANAIYGPSIFINTLITLRKTDANVIIDTQAMGTKAICLAVRFNNWLNRNKIKKGEKKPVRIRKVMTDLPTDKATHFFNSLKSLSKKDKALITLETTEPLLELPQGVTEDSLTPDEKIAYQQAFWKKHVGTGFAEIKYTDFPLRDAFNDKQLCNIANIHRNGLTVITNNQEEAAFFESLPPELIKIKDKGNDQKEVTFNVNENDKIMSLMLGSTGGIALKSYVQQAIAQAKSNRGQMGNGQFYFYVFCGKHEQNQDTLWAQVKEIIANEKNLPDNFHIIPLGAQGDKQIAPIFSRSDVLISRSGGLSSMEILKTQAENPQRKVFVHSAKQGFSKELHKRVQFLLKGIAAWEGGNARFMQDKIGAKITNPDYFEEDLQQISFFQPKMAANLTALQEPRQPLKEVLKRAVPHISQQNLDNNLSRKDKFKANLEFFKDREKAGHPPPKKPKPHN